MAGFLLAAAAFFLVCVTPGPTRAPAGEPLPAGPLRISLIMDDPQSNQAFLVVQEAYRRLGVAVVAEPMPAERALRAADAGLTDADTVRMEGLEASYPNLARVPEPVFTVERKAFTTGLSFPVNGWESLRPYGICYLHGIKVDERGTAGMRGMPADCTSTALRLLREGRCDVAVLESDAWMEVDRMDAGPLRELEPPIAVYPLYHYVNRRNVALVPFLAGELRRMREEGVIDATLAPGRETVKAAKARQTMP